MGRTRIELLSSGDIDMYDDVPAPLTFNIADVRQPDKRNAHFSKTIKVPGTKGNNLRFGHLFNITIGDTNFNPNIKAPCTLYIDDVPQISGFIQVLGIDIDDKGKIEYSVSIQGNISNIIQEIGDSELTDLDLSAFNHTLNRANQIATYSNDYTDGYCYPLIDYGFDNNINEYRAEHLIPAIFLRTLIDKIFSSVGYTYVSTFFDSERFKKLLIAGSSEGFKLTQTQVLARLFEAGLSVQTTIGALNTPQIVPFDTDINDPASAFDTGTSKWTCPETGYYDLQGDVTWYTTGTYAGSTVIPTHIQLYKNNSLLIDTYDQSVGTVANTRSVVISNEFLTAGDVLDIRLRTISSLYAGMSWVVQTSSKFYNKVNNGAIQAGDTVLMNNLLPLKIKQKDLFLDIVKMFGLYVEVDKNNSKKLFIDTRDDFYASGTTIDWTYKLDNSKLFEVTPMGDLNFKNFKYSYKDDKDFYNKKYAEDYKRSYGDYIYETENQFLKGTNETKILFSGTPLVAPTGDDRIIPKIWEVDTSNTVKNKPNNIRLLYNGGIKFTNLPYDYVDSTAATVTSGTNQYLYAGHLDSPTNPTFDLNFGVPSEVYYDTSIYTDANLFNIYHKKYVDEISNKDSKIVTAYFRLKPTDIAQLDFRNRFYFEGQNWRLNKIYDYNPISEDVTKCEFIKIKEGQSFIPHQISTGGWKPIGSYDEVITSGGLKPRSAIDLGTRNVLGSGLRSSIISGSYNYVSGGENINLIGSSGNTISDGLKNVTLINTHDAEITSGDVFYVNGVELLGLSTAWVDNSYDASYFFADSVGTWTVDSADVLVSRYKINGKTMIWSVAIEASTFAGGVAFPTLKIPEGKTATGYGVTNCIVRSGMTYYSDAVAQTSTTNISVYRLDSSAFANATNDVELAFTITFEIE